MNFECFMNHTKVGYNAPPFMMTGSATQSTIVSNWNTINPVDPKALTAQPYQPQFSQMVPYQGPTASSYIPMGPMETCFSQGPMGHQMGNGPVDITQEEKDLALGAAFYKEFARNTDKASRYFFPSSFLVFW